MIILTETTDSIQVVLAGGVATNQLECFSSWREISPGNYTPGRTGAVTNDTTDVDIVPPPNSSTQRVVDFISIYNTDTANATVTVKLDANGTEYVLFKTTLATTERLEYTSEGGFKVFTNSGAVKNSINQGSNTIGTGMSMVVLGEDIVNNNVTANTIADVTGLSFPVTANNTYYFEFVIPYTSAATATGSRWSINGPAFTRLNCRSEYTLAATTTTVNSITAYDIPAASNANSLTAGNVATIWGIIIPSADGSVIARFASEVTNSAITAKAGAIVRYIQVA